MAKKQPPRGPEDHGAKQGDPPKAARWKPGQSGNPGGRPKGKSLLAEIRDALDGDELLGKKNPGGKTTRRILAEAALMHAIKGRSAYFREVMERLFGKVPLRVETPEGSDTAEADIMPPHAVEAAMRAYMDAIGESGGPQA